MKNITIILFITIIFTGCVNKRGLSTMYYSECVEYYDARGNYHNKCDDHTYEYSEMASDTKSIFVDEEEEKKVVW